MPDTQRKYETASREIVKVSWDAKSVEIARENARSKKKDSSRPIGVCFPVEGRTLQPELTSEVPRI